MTGISIRKTMAQPRIRVIAARRGDPSKGRADGLILLAGPAATGRARAAAAIARDLGRPLHRLDLAAVISRYIAEAEKALNVALAAAEQAGAVLQIDEADALFGKRTEVGDAHDRHAGIDPAALLARIERHKGVVILSCRRKAALDPAFLRRLRFSANMRSGPGD